MEHPTSVPLKACKDMSVLVLLPPPESLRYVSDKCRLLQAQMYIQCGFPVSVGGHVNVIKTRNIPILQKTCF